MENGTFVLVAADWVRVNFELCCWGLCGSRSAIGGPRLDPANQPLGWRGRPGDAGPEKLKLSNSQAGLVEPPPEPSDRVKVGTS